MIFQYILEVSQFIKETLSKHPRVYVQLSNGLTTMRTVNSNHTCFKLLFFIIYYLLCCVLDDECKHKHMQNNFLSFKGTLFHWSCDTQKSNLKNSTLCFLVTLVSYCCLICLLSVGNQLKPFYLSDLGKTFLFVCHNTRPQGGVCKGQEII